MNNWINNVLVSNNLLVSPLIITDLNKLKITKIRYDKLYFKYDNTRYFVISHNSCGDQWYSLYRKEFINNKCVVNKIASSGWTLADIMYLLDNKSSRKNCIVYSHIDKEYFVSKLKENKLIQE